MSCMNIVLNNTKFRNLYHRNDTFKELSLFKDYSWVTEINFLLFDLGVPETL